MALVAPATQTSSSSSSSSSKSTAATTLNGEPVFVFGIDIDDIDDDEPWAAASCPSPGGCSIFLPSFLRRPKQNQIMNQSRFVVVDERTSKDITAFNNKKTIAVSATSYDIGGGGSTILRANDTGTKCIDVQSKSAHSEGARPLPGGTMKKTEEEPLNPTTASCTDQILETKAACNSDDIDQGDNKRDVSVSPPSSLPFKLRHDPLGLLLSSLSD
jgi:hypothetical protein